MTAAPAYSDTRGIRTAGLTNRWPRGLRIYVVLQGVWIALYALFGKGFAYTGISPFYVGEILLTLALVTLAVSRRVRSILFTPVGVLLALFLGWQAFCAAQSIGVYGLDTFRDSVIWAYAVFGCVLAALILRMPGLLSAIIEQFSRCGRWFLVLGPVAWLATTYLRDYLPRWPGTTITIPLVKGDEYCVHLAGVLALALQGFGVVRQGWVLLILADAMLAMNVRSGLLAFVVAASFAVVLRPRPQRLVVVVACITTLVTVMAAFDFRVTVPGTTRELSVQQLGDNLQSVIRSTSSSDLEGTRQWRLIWWQRIVDYTVFGPYFWMGKGYGVNLADSDGFQVGTRDEPLRSPHSSHLTFLARSGVPGFVLWAALQLTWVSLMLKSYFQARRHQAKAWVGIFAWLMAYWLAFIMAAGFDVFLEGPMAGIPFWSLFGVGWGAHILFQSQLHKAGVRIPHIQTKALRMAYAE